MGHRSPSDTELLRGLVAGSEEAFDELVRRYWDAAAGYARTFLPDLDRARDVVQTAFIRLWEHRRRWDPNGSVRAILLRTVRNLAHDELRKDAVRRKAAEHLAGDPPSPRGNPHRELEARELEEAAEAAIRSLPKRRREAFVLARFHRLSHREIAEIMGLSPQTVANHISAALADLRTVLAPYLKE